MTLKRFDRLLALRMMAVYDLITRWGSIHEYEMERLMAASESMAKLAEVFHGWRCGFKGCKAIAFLSLLQKT